MRILKFRSVNRPTNFAASFKPDLERSINRVMKIKFSEPGISRSVPVTPGSSGALWREGWRQDHHHVRGHKMLRM